MARRVMALQGPGPPTRVLSAADSQPSLCRESLAAEGRWVVPFQAGL